MIRKITTYIKENRETIREIVITAVCAYFVFGMILCPVFVFDRSMMPTIRNGSFLLGYRLAQTYHRGDIVAILLSAGILLLPCHW